MYAHVHVQRTNIHVYHSLKCWLYIHLALGKHGVASIQRAYIWFPTCTFCLKIGTQVGAAWFIFQINKKVKKMQSS